MQPTYTNSKNEVVVISEMETPHLIFALCKLSRELGSGTLDNFSTDQKKNEVASMHAELCKRSATHKYVDAFATSILEYESYTFSAEASGVTREEAEKIAVDYVRIALGSLIENQEISLTADGIALSDSLDGLRENE